MSNSSTTVFVVGATGASGKHVVKQLLLKGSAVKVVVRSKEKLLNLLSEDGSNFDKSSLKITEASFLDMPESQLEEMIKGCTAAVSCLGHNINLKGMYGSADKGLVTKSAKKITNAIEKVNPKCKFILMGTDAVAHPKDDPRTGMERFVLFLLRYLLPPHYDNEVVAEYMLNDIQTKIEWTIVRPTDLQNGVESKYRIYEKPPGGLFGSGICTRANVASFMVKLILDSNAWKEYKHRMPVVHDMAENIDATKEQDK